MILSTVKISPTGPYLSLKTRELLIGFQFSLLFTKATHPLILTEYSLCVFTKSIIRQLAGGPEPRTTQQGVFVVFEKKMKFKLVTEERIGLKNY